MSYCRIIVLSNYRVVELSYYRIIVLSNYRIVVLSYCRGRQFDNTFGPFEPPYNIQQENRACFTVAGGGGEGGRSYEMG